MSPRIQRAFRAPKACLIVSALFFLSYQLQVPSFAQEAKKIRMAYSALSVAFLNVFVARDAGLFKKQNLDVKLIQMAGPLPIAALAAGEIDYLTGYTTGIIATGQGAPLKGILIALRKPPFYLVAEPGVQRLGDLAGDRIGSLQHLVVRLLLRHKGADPEKAIFCRADQRRRRN